MELEHDTHLHPDIAVLHENGVHAIAVTKNEWDDFVAQREFVFVDFYAPWYKYMCVCCYEYAYIDVDNMI
jgi:thiol:disulfide interchange protein